MREQHVSSVRHCISYNDFDLTQTTHRDPGVDYLAYLYDSNGTSVSNFF